MAVFCIASAGLLGLNVSQTTLYQAVSLIFSALGISILFSFFFRFNGKVKRILPRYATVGQKAEYKIEITNDATSHQKDLVLFEDFHDPRPSMDELVSRKEPFEHLRNAWDKRTYYYRWLWQIQQNKKADFKKIHLPDLAPQSRTLVQSHFTPHARGYINLTGCSIGRPDPLGFARGTTKLKDRQNLLVLPKRYALKLPELESQRKYHSGGVALASSIGNSEEFMSLRDYRPGDPMRNIHWKTFAKKDQLIIKEFEDEYFIRHALILDTALTSQNEQIFEEAVSIAASYLSIIQTHESLLDLMFVGNKIYSFSSGRGLAHTEKMMEIIACVDPRPDKSVLELKPVINDHLAMLSGSICIFLDWDEHRKEIVDIFTGAAIPALIIVVCEDKEKTEQMIIRDNGLLGDIKVVRVGRVEQDLNRS